MTKIGFVGVGYWGPNLLRNFANMSDSVEVSVICDADKAKLGAIKKSYPAAKLTTDFDELALDGSVDAVVLALPAQFHYKFAKKALAAGKDVFVEKPLAMTASECEDIIKTAEKADRIIFVGHTFLYNPAVNEIKRYIEDGKLGDVYYLYSQRLNLGKVREDVDVMWNLAPHDVSIMLHLVRAQPKSVSARGFYYLRKNIADVAFITLEFANGVSAHIHVSWLDPNKIRKVTIVGSKKMVVYDDMAEDARIVIYDKGIDKKHINTDMGRYDNYEKFLFIHRSGDILIPKVAFDEPLKLEVKSFIECVQKRSRPVTDGIHGLETVRILEAATKSLRQEGKVVKL